MNRTIVVILIALAAITILTFRGVGQCGFIDFDDNFYVTDNYHVRQGLSLDGTVWALISFSASNWHPLTWLSHMLDVQLYGMNPAGHHITNLVLHTANAMLLFWLLLRMTGSIWPSAFVAAVFALHPAHVESVAWVAERKDVLSTLFWLLTMLAWVRYVQKPSGRRYALALGLFALGLMAKPMLVTLPLILLVIDYWPLGRSGLRKLVIEKLPFAGLSILSAILTILAQRHSIAPAGEMDMLTRLTNAVVSYGRYIWTMVYPANLAIYYPHPNRPLLFEAAVIGVLLIAVTAAAYRCRGRYPYILAGWLWYLITLVPVIGILQVGDQSHADRYTYVPLIGMFVAIAWAGQDAVRRAPAARPALAALSFIVLASASVVTRQDVQNWKDSLTVFSHAVAVAPDNPRMQACLGDALVQLGRTDEAMPHLEKALTYKGHDGSAYNALGKIYRDRGDVEKTIDCFTKASGYYWMQPKSERNLGVYLVSLGRYGEAIPHLQKAIELDPYNTDALSLLAVALCQTGKVEEASRPLATATSLEPDKGIVNYAQGYLLSRAGNIEGAIKAYRKSATVEPTYATYGDLGQLQASIGRLADAAESCRAAIRLDPDRAEAHGNLAMLLSAMGRKDEAIAEAKKAMELAPGDEEAKAFYRSLTGGK